ncbi:hypothetical protein AB1Y20_022569 [Prymnesium parvum]|uniref:SHSP domain-containing protein n=1 Tax=Prymnesium parvum TaxID=97485 RepID=A0AB34JJE2_PRYPA
MVFASFPLDVRTSVLPLDMLLPVDSCGKDRPVARSFTRQFHEANNEYTLSLSLPGVSPSDLELCIEDGVLTISGTTKVGMHEYTAAHRVRVPQDAEAPLARATAENGILSISLPKRPKVTHEIAVASSGDALPTAFEGDYVVNLPIPGVRPSDLKVVCEEGMLSIAVETNTTQHATRTVKRIRLPRDDDASAAAAAAEYGILRIVLPKRAAEVSAAGQKSAHRIEVSHGSSSSSTLTSRL